MLSGVSVTRKIFQLWALDFWESQQPHRPPLRCGLRKYQSCFVGISLETEEILFAKREFRAGRYKSTKTEKIRMLRTAVAWTSTNLWPGPGQPVAPRSPPTTGGREREGLWWLYTRGLLLWQVPSDICIQHGIYSTPGKSAGEVLILTERGSGTGRSQRNSHPRKTHSFYRPRSWDRPGWK